jgi:NADP-dependent 3-hydroxy acid dehydrogenase YdfG
VVLADRDEERIGKAAEGLRAAGHNTIGVACDVTDTAQVEAMIERTVNMLCSPVASFMVGHAMTVDGGLLAG